jgi:hypothetical protein
MPEMLAVVTWGAASAGRGVRSTAASTMKRAIHFFI